MWYYVCIVFSDAHGRDQLPMCAQEATVAAPGSGTHQGDHEKSQRHQREYMQTVWLWGAPLPVVSDRCGTAFTTFRRHENPTN